MELVINPTNQQVAAKPPVEPFDLVNKAYVDGLISAHRDNLILHLTENQKTWLNNITVTPEEVNFLAGITSNLTGLIGGKLDKTGGSLTGNVSLIANPVSATHLVHKGYVDNTLTTVLSLSGGAMTGFIILHSDPVLDLHPSTKRYTDTAINNHANNTNVHLSVGQKTLLDSLNVTANQLNELAGITSNVQSQLNTKFSTDGGVINGDVEAAAGFGFYSSKTPTQPGELTNKGYVDQLVSSKQFLNPIICSRLISFVENNPPLYPADGDCYIVGPSPTGAWAGYQGYAVIKKDAGWVPLQSRPVTVGDRFGVTLVSGTPDISLSSYNKGIITVTIAVVGNYQFTQDTLKAGSSVIIYDPDADNFGDTLSYTDEGIWVITNTSVNLSPMNGLYLNGKYLNIGHGKGFTVSPGLLNLSIDEEKGLTFTVLDKLCVKLDGSTITSSSNGLKLNDSIKSVIDKAVTTDGNYLIDGGIVINSTGSIRSLATPVDVTDLITKGYVDGINNSLTSSINSLNTIVGVLNTDPVTKGYVNIELDKKLDKAGGTLTGPLVLNGAPTLDLHPASKKYTDDRLAGKLDKAGGDLTGYLKLVGDPVESLHAVPLDYLNTRLVNLNTIVNTALSNKLDKAGGTLTGPLVLNGAPTLDLHAVTKLYSDTNLQTHINDTTLHLTSTQRSLLNGITAASSEINFTVGVTSAIQTQLNNKLGLDGGVLTNFITLHADPTNPLHPSTKNYTDSSITALSNSVSLSVGSLQTRTSSLETIVAVLNTDPVTKFYTDTQLANKLDKSGGLLTNFITLHADPTNPLHPATKQYVDNLSLGLKTKERVRLATTVQLNAVYNNGTNGINATLTGSGNGLLYVDGKAVTLNDRILVRLQSSGIQNGDYVVIQVGDVGTPYILRRATTLDEASEVPGSYFNVYDGDTLKGTGWVATVTNPATFTLGSDDIALNQFFGPGSYIGGSGMVLSGNTFNIGTVDPSRIVVNADNIDLALTGIVAGTYRSITVDGYGRATAGSNPTTLAGYGITDAVPLNGSGATGTWGISITGSSATANKLTTARRINGALFDGSSDITLWSVYSLGYRRVSLPQGAQTVVASNAVTGALRINLPTSIYALSLMIKFEVDIYEKLTGKSFTLSVSGYQDGAGNWTCPTAYIVGDNSVDNRKNVRFGKDISSGRFVIYLGELDTVWNNPHAFIHSVSMGGNNADITYGWVIDFETTAFQTVVATIVPQSGYSSSSNIGQSLVKRDDNGNFTAGTITANLNGKSTSSDKLATARTITITGAVTSSATSFDGSTDISVATDLADSGITAGTYSKVTFTSKGVATAGSNPTTLADYGITDAVSLTAYNSKIAELENTINELKAYIFSRT